VRRAVFAFGKKSHKLNKSSDLEGRRPDGTGLALSELGVAISVHRKFVAMIFVVSPDPGGAKTSAYKGM